MSEFVSSSATITELSARIIFAWKNQTRLSAKRIYPPFVFDVNGRTVFNGGNLIQLTDMEYKLALYFFSHPSTVLSREKLLMEVWGIYADIDSRRVDTHVCRVRNRMGLSKKDSQWKIRTIYQAGYILEKCEHQSGQSSVLTA